MSSLGAFDNCTGYFTAPVNIVVLGNVVTVNDEFGPYILIEK